jgi:hypothetical protein
LSVEEIAVIKEGYKAEGRENIHYFAVKQKVVPFIAHLFYKLKIDESYWEKIHGDYTRRNTKILQALDNIFFCLEKMGADKVFIYENFGALLASDSCIGCFNSGDVDLYAEVYQKKIVTEVLAQNGFFPKPTSHSAETIKTEYYNSNIFEKGFGINVMWKPMSRTKLPFVMDIANSIEWCRLSIYQGTHIKTPEVSALMYLCLLHISIHSFLRSPAIRLYIDVDRVALKNPDWDRIAEFALKDHTFVRAFTAAILTKRLLGTYIPENIEKTFIQENKNILRLLSFTFDRDNNFLRKEPSQLGILLIEILSSDKNWIHSLARIFMPSSSWIREYYLHDGSPLIAGYIRHLKGLI